MALPSLLHNKLRQALMDNGPFDSNEELRGIFADPRLIQWRHSVPEASNRASRVNFTIAKLLDDWNVAGENALYLFLYVLGEYLQKPAFGELAEEVRQATIQDKINACQQELKQIAEHLERGWSDPAYANSRRAKVEEELRQWDERKAETAKGLQQWEERLKAAADTESVAVTEDYIDIEIHILGKANDVYPVNAKLSDGSSFSGMLHLDETTLLALEADSEKYGEFLSRALFDGDIDRAYSKAETLAEAKTEGRLRLRLWIDNVAAELQALRWERLCYWRNKALFRLATTALRPFSRYFGLGLADPEPLTARPIRVLAVIANPRNLADYGLAPLDVEGEIINLLDGLDPFLGSIVDLTIMSGQTSLSSELSQRLAKTKCGLEKRPASLDAVIDLLAHPPDYHILHFLGHGTYSGRQKRAALYYEDQVGNAQLISDKTLAEGLHDAGNIPHLVFLAACESAKREAENNPFVGLAPKLIQIGVPAVVAMQDAISVSLANKLARTFYRSLFEYGTVDKAMNQARSVIARENTLESAIPVLFTRLRSGYLFTRSVEH